jgi:hypothetical protein
MNFRFIHAERARYPVRVLCRVLEVSRSGFYAWCRRAPARRVQAEQRLTQAIQAAHRGSRGTYGSPRIHAELKAQGLRGEPLASLQRLETHRRGLPWFARGRRDPCVAGCGGRTAQSGPRTIATPRHEPRQETV